LIEIAPFRYLAIFHLLSLALTSVVVAILVRRLAKVPLQRRSLLRAIMVGVVCALASTAFWSSRHAGTGTQMAWGWPRMNYGRWVSWETAERIERVRWQGIVENTVFYTAAALLAGSLIVAVRREPRSNKITTES
jgi:hypothetical protein